MDYRIVYVEDLNAESVLHDLSAHGLNVVHCKPTTFTETIADIEVQNPQLILMDYRLMQGGGEVDAPSIAQHFRSHAIDSPKLSVPIVLLSNDRKIQKFYKDFTSHDLFDFAIGKGLWRDNKTKYSTLIKELIESYKAIATSKSEGKSLISLINIPSQLKSNLDPRIEETLDSKKYHSSIYMTSAFVLNNVVKPVGVLIGEDVLSARLGISKESPDWGKLRNNLEKFEYSGIYSTTYRRWWADGLEAWWNENISKDSYLRTLNSTQKSIAICEKFPHLDLQKVTGDNKSLSDSFWTICQFSQQPIDPSEAFELSADTTQSPWLESKYYCFESIRDNDLANELTEFERTRFKEIAKGQ